MVVSILRFIRKMKPTKPKLKTSVRTPRVIIL